VATSEKSIDTGLKKFGAIIGDRAEIGCNSVLSPGSIIGRDTIIYPNTSWRGVLPSNSIGKMEPQTLKVIPRQSRD
jgi:acetyltransferase-like isoleucine patch superfamily enzyme